MKPIKPKRDPWAPPAPKGKVYQWNVVAINDVPVAKSIMQDYRDAGWEDVPAKRHPKFDVYRDGCRLMKRPMKVHEAAIKRGYEYAIKQQLDAISKGTSKTPFPAVLWTSVYVMTNYGWVPHSLYREIEGVLDGAWDAQERFGKLRAAWGIE